MTMTPEQASWFSDIFGRLVANVEDVLLGKTFVIRLGFTALLSEGHLLLEDYPGTGKTSLARAIAQSVDGTTHDVGVPFMVIATQNPIEQAGTYRLPEAQLDRFLMKASIGYPDHASTLRILEGAGTRAHDTVVPSIATADTIVEMARLARTVHVDPSVNDYVSRLVDATRSTPEVRLGASVRGALALVRAAKTMAAGAGRHYVIPDDIKALAEPVLAHRLVLDPEAEFDGVTTSSIMSQILIETPPPSDRQAV